MAYIREESLKRKTDYNALANGGLGFASVNGESHFNYIIPFEELLQKDLVEWDTTQLANTFRCLKYLSGQQLYWLYMNIVAYYDMNNISPNPALALHDDIILLSKS